jgi:hypothetical protein
MLLIARKNKDKILTVLGFEPRVATRACAPAQFVTIAVLTLPSWQRILFIHTTPLS